MFTKMTKYVFGRFTATLREKSTVLCIDNGGLNDDRQAVCLTEDEQQALYLILRDVNAFSAS
jgi:hypothetical protein